MTKDEALLKLQHYCAYQDRCHKEVRSKGISIGIYGEWLEELISELIKNNFLDEERYARSYARGKFRFKKWGRNRIIKEFKYRDISEYCIRKALSEIDEEEYLSILNDVYEKKLEQFSTIDDFKKHQKAMNYCISRGFEPELVYQVLIHKKKS